jgi:hypothetical protein
MEMILLAFVSHAKHPRIHLMCHGHCVRYLGRNAIVIERPPGSVALFDRATMRLFGIFDEPKAPGVFIEHRDARVVAKAAQLVLRRLVGKASLKLEPREGD